GERLAGDDEREDRLGDAGDARRRAHVADRDGRTRAAGAAVLVGGGQRDDVRRVIVRREGEAGAAPRGVGGAVLRDGPARREAGRRVGEARIGHDTAEGDRRPFRAARRGAGERDGRRRVAQGQTGGRRVGGVAVLVVRVDADGERVGAVVNAERLQLRPGQG